MPFEFFVTRRIAFLLILCSPYSRNNNIFLFKFPSYSAFHTKDSRTPNFEYSDERLEKKYSVNPFDYFEQLTYSF